MPLNRSRPVSQAYKYKISTCATLSARILGLADAGFAGNIQSVSMLARFIQKALNRWNGSPEGNPEESPHMALGREGERLAVKYLRRHGFKVLYRNFRAHGGGEVDIVCRDKAEKVLVFVEVKTRSSTEYGDPSGAVNAEKQRLISRGALAWLRMLGNPEIQFRFDIVEVLMTDTEPRITLVRDAFHLSKPFIY
jgi:putative endonuclease